MAKYKVTYTEEESKFIIVEAENEYAAQEKCDAWLSGDSTEDYVPEEGDWYEFRIDDAEEIES